MSQTNDANRSARIHALTTLGEGYQTGWFESVEPLLDADCVFESQWVIEPMTGRTVIMDYLRRKGEALRKGGSFPQYTLIELIGNMQLSPQQHMNVNGELIFGSFGLLYEDGKICLLLRQSLDDEDIEMVVDIKLNESGRVVRVDLCMPGWFRFKPWSE